MGLVDVSPPAILPPRVGRARSAGTARSGGSDLAAGIDGPPRPTPELVELIKACAEDALRRGDDLATSRIAQRFAPPAPHTPPRGPRSPNVQMLPAAALATFRTGMRRLTLFLVLATLLPNLTAAAFWFGLIAPPWSKPVTPAASAIALPATQPPAPSPVLSAPAALEAETGSEIGFPIALDGTDGVPAGSAIVIKGLPRGASLSNGRGEAGAWRLRPGEIGDLYLAIRNAASEHVALAIQLVAPDGRLVADASTVLRVTAAPPPEPAMESLSDGHAAIEPQRAALEGSAEVTGALPHAVIEAEAETPPLPTRRPVPAVSENGAGGHVTPSAYVNLRGAPATSAAVIAVIAKGTRLRVMDRKRGWVRVKDPASPQIGWIYSSYLAASQ